MKSSVIAYVGWLLILGIFGLYAYGLIIAIRLSWVGDIPADSYPEALSTAINSIQALLLTNMGMLLGVAITNPSSPVSRALMLQTGPTAAALPVPDPLSIKEKIQMAALLVYVTGLIACTITWGHDKFVSDSTKIIDVVSTSGKMLIGVALSYLTVVLRK